MKFLIAGAGAIGAYIGGRMAAAGQDVTLFARGPHFLAMKENGVRVQSADNDFTVRPEIIDDLERAGKPDVVFLGVKAHGLPALVSRIPAGIRESAVFVSTQNGIPWWYFHKHGGPFEGAVLESVDPGGVISSVIDAERVIGSIVYFSTEIVEPGVVRHIEGSRISLGEPDGTRSERIKRIAEALIKAGLRAPVTTRIRNEIWVKILGNASFNPISALTRATLVRMLQDHDVAALIRNVMMEAEAVAQRIGVELAVSIEQRMAGGEKVGEHKTSMLQDLEAGRPLELEAVVGAVLELGRRLDIRMPHMQTIYACTKLLAKTAGQV